MQFSKWITLGFSALCLVAVATVVQMQHLYYMAAILLTLPGVSYALGWYALRGLEFTRIMPPTAWEGEEGGITYLARNRTRFARFFLTIQEQLPEWIVAVDADSPLFNALGEDVTHINHRVRYLRRGVYKAKAFEVMAMDPLGVFAFTKHVTCQGELVVYPTPQSISSLAITGTDRYGWQEFVAMSLRGNSVEPDGVRPYLPGDPLRRIHWRQTARTGKLSVIEFEEPQSVSATMLLDLQRGTHVGDGSASHVKESTLEYAVRFAASIAQHMVSQGANVRLLRQLAGAEKQELGEMAVTSALPGRGQAQLLAILDTLARVEANSNQSMAELIAENMAEFTVGATLLVITANPDSALEPHLVRLTAAGVNVGIIYIDPDSFSSVTRRNSAERSQRFLTEVLNTGAHAFVLRHNPLGILEPEAVADVA